MGFGGGVYFEQCVNGFASAGVDGGDGQGDLGDDAEPVGSGEVVTLKDEVAPAGDAGLGAAGEGFDVCGVAHFPWFGVPLTIDGICQEPDAFGAAVGQGAGLRSGLGVLAHDEWPDACPPAEVALCVFAGEDEDDFAWGVEGIEECAEVPCAVADVDGADAAQPGVIWFGDVAEGTDAGGGDGMEGDAAWRGCGLGGWFLLGGCVGVGGSADVAAGGAAKQVAALRAGVPGCGADFVRQLALCPLGGTVGEVPFAQEVEGGGSVEGETFDEDAGAAVGGIVPAGSGDGWFEALDVGAGTLDGGGCGGVWFHSWWCFDGGDRSDFVDFVDADLRWESP